MKKYLDKLKKKIYFNKNLFIFLLTLVLIGVASGAIFSLLLKDSDKKLVSDYLNEFMLNISNSKMQYKTYFFNNMIFTLGFSLIIWIFGISIIGIILILPFLFIKSFTLGFSIGSILANFKLKGIIISLIYIVPHHVINILIYILISAYAIMISYRMFQSMKDKKIFDFKIIMNKYTFILVFSLVMLFITCLYESFILPEILKLVANLLK